MTGKRTARIGPFYAVFSGSGQERHADAGKEVKGLQTFERNALLLEFH
jgi:hypothetical protein